MSAVDDEQGLPGGNVEPSGPADIPNTVVDILLRNLPSLFDQGVSNGQHHGGIVELMVPQQRQNQVLPGAAVKYLTIQRMLFQPKRVKIRLFQADVLFPADLLVHRFHRRGTAVHHSVAALLEDAGLGQRNLLHGIAQILRMIQADVGDHRHLGHFNDVGGIQRAAHAHFQHHDVALLAAEILEGDAGNQLEFRGGFLHGVRQGLDVLCHRSQIFIGNLHAVHLHPLMEAVDVRRGVQSRAVARLLQNGRGHGGGAALAVGARNVDKLQLFLGIPHFCQKGLGAAQSGNAALPADGMDIFDGL